MTYEPFEATCACDTIHPCFTRHQACKSSQLPGHILRWPTQGVHALDVYEHLRQKVGEGGDQSKNQGTKLG
jgi:hypothetical protein